MDLDIVKQCFKKYIDYLNTNESITINDQVNFETISIDDIDKITQLTFMDYIIKHNKNEKVNVNSASCILYKHLNSLIRQYQSTQTKKETSSSWW